MLSKNRSHNNIINVIILLSFIIFSILSSIILCHTHSLMGAGDMPFHIKRIFELKESIINGNLFPKYSFNEFNGSSVMTMYPYLNLLPVVILSFVIKSGIKLIYVSFLLNTFIAFIVSYYSSYRYENNRLVSYLFSIFYCTSTFYLDYAFVNMDLGMLSVIIFLPIVLFGFLNVLKSNEWVELSIGMSLIIFSHVLSVLIIVAFLLVWLLIDLKEIKIITIKDLLKASVLSILTTSIFWVPLVYITLSNMNGINRPGAGTLFGTSLSDVFLGALSGKGTFCISIIPIFGIILSIIYFKKLTKAQKQMAILSILSVLILSNLFPWGITQHGILRIFRGFQFTWRFCIIPQLLLSYLSAVCFIKLIDSLKRNHEAISRLSFVGIILISLTFQLISQCSIVNNNINSHSLTESYMHENTRPFNDPSKQHVHHETVYMSNLNLPHPKNMRRPQFYKIVNQHQFNHLISPYMNIGIDYYPMKSMPRIDSVVHNYAFTQATNKNIPIKYNGYNKLKINNNLKNVTSMFLPWVKYNGENLSILVNGKHIKNKNNKYSLVKVTHLKKGINNISVKVQNNEVETIIEIVLSIISILIYIILLFICFRKHYLRNRVI